MLGTRRRKFNDAGDIDSARAHAALALVRRLYDVEDAVRAELEKIADPAEHHAVRVTLRQSKSVPILAELHGWLNVQRQIVLPKSPIAQAMNYTLGNCPALCCYTQQPFCRSTTTCPNAPCDAWQRSCTDAERIKSVCAVPWLQERV